MFGSWYRFDSVGMWLQRYMQNLIPKKYIILHELFAIFMAAFDFFKAAFLPLRLSL
jgi:hypothetical protein